MPRETETMTVAQVAERLKVQPKTVRKFIRSGTLKASNIGTPERPRYAIREAILLAFLEAREVVGVEEEPGGV